MTQEDKELLLKDLCARFPYGVKCRFEITIDTYKTIEFSREGTNGRLVDFDELYCYWFNEGFILPYLRPMSSMTEDENKEYAEIWANREPYMPGGTVDFFNAHHLDYRGLIEKGLALEAPKDVYNI